MRFDVISNKSLTFRSTRILYNLIGRKVLVKFEQDRSRTYVVVQNNYRTYSRIFAPIFVY